MRRQRLAPLLAEEACRGFDLTCGPLFRARLYRLAPDAHCCAGEAPHHFRRLVDGILIRELGELVCRLLPGRGADVAGAQASVSRLRALAAQLAPG